MGDAHPIRTLGDYSKPSHEGYRNTIELPIEKNMVPLRSDTIWNDNDDIAADGGINKTHTKMPLKEVEEESEAEKGTKQNQSKELKEKKQRRHLALSPGPVYEAILRKKITRKEDIGGNFEIPCNIGGLKRMNALVDQGSDVNVMPLSTYMKLTDERPAKTNIRLSLPSHSYIYHLGIANVTPPKLGRSGIWVGGGTS
ncbi:hypothetical protein Tco_1162872 [Tanacetum coccineum]